jgi:hypothetical protein
LDVDEMISAIVGVVMKFGWIWQTPTMPVFLQIEGIVGCCGKDVVILLF